MKKSWQPIAIPVSAAVLAVLTVLAFPLNRKNEETSDNPSQADEILLKTTIYKCTANRTCVFGADAYICVSIFVHWVSYI